MDDKTKDEKPIELGLGGEEVGVTPLPMQVPAEPPKEGVVVSSSSPPSSTVPLDLPPVVLKTQPRDGQKKRIVIGVLALVLMLGGLSAGLVALRQRQIVTKEAAGEIISAGNCQTAAGQTSCPTTVNWNFTAELDTNYIIRVTSTDLNGQNSAITDWRGFWHGPAYCNKPRDDSRRNNDECDACSCSPQINCNYINGTCSPDQSGSDSYALVCGKKYVFKLWRLDSPTILGQTGEVQATGCTTATPTPTISPTPTPTTTPTPTPTVTPGPVSWTVKVHALCPNGDPVTNQSTTAYYILLPPDPEAPVYDALAPGVHTLNITSTNPNNVVYVGLASQVEGVTGITQYTFPPVSPFPIAAMYKAQVFTERRWAVVWPRAAVQSGTYDLNFTAPTAWCVTSTPTPTPTPSGTPGPTPTGTPVSTPTPTPNPACNSTCTSTSTCQSGLVCDTGGHCRNPGCTSEPDCVCHQPQPTPTPTTPPAGTPGPTTPPAGFSLPTWGTMFAAGITILGGLLLLGL